MKLTFFSNFLNHHQIPVSNEFYRMLGDNYTFVACEKVPEERIRLGYQTDFSEYPYLLEISTDEHYQQAIKLGEESDVVIIGSADEIFIKKRIASNKLTFRYSERLFKTNKHIILYPYLILKRYPLDTVLRRKNVYMLSSSAFTPLDYSMFLAYPNRFLKWGYFPSIKHHDIQSLIQQKPSTHIEFIWVGRMIDWKRPMMAISVVSKLIQKGYACQMTMIGTGNLLDELRRYVHQNHLDEQIHLIGALESSKVREYMEKAHIFLFTSNKEEGWGAVLNEAMNSGCACYAYYKIGSAPYLIHHDQNGVLFTSQLDLLKRLEKDLHRPSQIEALGRKAYERIVSLWTPELAASRFIETANALLSGKQIPFFPDGPLSKAKILSHRSVRRAMKKAMNHERSRQDIV